MESRLKPKKNADIRARLVKYGIHHIIIAEMLGVDRATIFRYLNDESEETREKLNVAIDDVIREDAEWRKENGVPFTVEQ
jgi:2-hydroxy-3-keto-5-methylthiopentenyl-1-phosphate phosphatase